MSLIAPGAAIGILGGGQLGRMLAVAAAQLGYRTHIYCPEADSPAFEVAGAFTIADYEDRAALERFAASVGVVTFEFENVANGGLKHLAARVPVHPSPEVLAVCQHRLHEKEFVRAHGVGTAPFMAVESVESLHAGMEKIGLPAILKTARLGYDGKGQATIRDMQEAAAAWEKLGASLAPSPLEGSKHRFEGWGGEASFILEGFVDFAMEISVIAARNAQGEVACYPPVQNIHRHHILYQTIAPAPLPAALRDKAVQVARHLAEALQLVGLLAVEMFVTKDGALLVNELAPRPHNSGHWTLDACATSQFEQAVRAVCGLPLGSTRPLCDAVMTNLIGDEVNGWRDYLAQPDTCLHLYGKKEARPGRKMGHVTVLKLPLSP